MTTSNTVNKSSVELRALEPSEKTAAYLLYRHDRNWRVHLEHTSTLSIIGRAGQEALNFGQSLEDIVGIASIENSETGDCHYEREMTPDELYQASREAWIRDRHGAEFAVFPDTIEGAKAFIEAAAAHGYKEGLKAIDLAAWTLDREGHSDRLGARIAPSQVARWELYADRSDMTVSELVRDAVDAYMSENSI